MMKALIVRHEQPHASTILHSYLNERGRNPVAHRACLYVTDYPEPGVMRSYCSGSFVSAWMDEVLIPSDFRQSASAPRFS